jgi:hypothetical protein
MVVVTLLPGFRDVFVGIMMGVSCPFVLEVLLVVVGLVVLPSSRL